ncbi:MAG: beta-glucuronidase [Lachnospiraceae bacterium]|nr:beta-glucuronidase [Lachnospiraceae bacterium]
MKQNVVLKTNPPKIRTVNNRLIAYNIEMTEVTGGTFWKAYTPAQIEGTEPFPEISDWKNMNNLQQYYGPVDLYDPVLRRRAGDIGPAWVRVSGTWANKTYYDFDGHTGGVVPEGFQNLLTREQWVGVLDFVRDIGGKLLVSVANCPGIHSASEPWTPEQAKLLFDFNRDYGVPISAAEFTNEPTMMSFSGLPEGYTAAGYARDQDLFGAWLKKNYPECLFVGPCSVGDIDMVMGGNLGGRIASNMGIITTETLLEHTTMQPDVFSYHYYNGVSERGAAIGGHWPEEECLSENYLKVAADCARQYAERRDRFAPGGQLWVTESGDAGCGGNTWASTYLDVPRTLNEIGEFCKVSDGVIFHNTLASSDYGYLQHGTFEPRPAFYAVLLWKRLMGDIVYDSGEPIREGAHVFAHSRADGKDGAVWLIINNSRESTSVVLPEQAVRYTLTGDGKMRSRTMQLNGKPLSLQADGSLPELEGTTQGAGVVEVPAGSCVFLVL